MSISIGYNASNLAVPAAWPVACVSFFVLPTTPRAPFSLECAFGAFHAVPAEVYSNLPRRSAFHLKLLDQNTHHPTLTPETAPLVSCLGHRLWSSV